MSIRVVLDASVLVWWLLDSQGSPAMADVERLLPVAAVTAVNLAEVLYVLKSRSPGVDLQAVERELTTTGLTVVGVDPDDGCRIAELVSWSRLHRGPDGGSLSLGDAVCIGVAERFKVPVATRDTYWSLVDAQCPVHVL
jgi:PIN domain nuclease of toxin-antitoxin system